MITELMRMTYRMKPLINELKLKGEDTSDLFGASESYLVYLASLYGFNGRDFIRGEAL